MLGKVLVVSITAASIVVGTGYLLSEDNGFDFSWNTTTVENESQYTSGQQSSA